MRPAPVVSARCKRKLLTMLDKIDAWLSSLLALVLVALAVGFFRAHDAGLATVMLAASASMVYAAWRAHGAGTSDRRARGATR